MSYTKIYANDNSATYAVMRASQDSPLTWDASTRTICERSTGRAWRLRNHRGGVVIRPVRATGAKSI